VSLEEIMEVQWRLDLFQECRTMLAPPPRIVVTRLWSFTSPHCWSCGILKMLQELWVIGSFLHASLPPSPTAMTPQLGFDTAVVVGSPSINIASLCFRKRISHSHFFSSSFWHYACIVHLLLFLCISRNPFYFLLLYN